MAQIWLFNGPNMNMLEHREEFYGQRPLVELEDNLRALALKLGHELETWQGHNEAEAISQVHSLVGQVDGVVANFAAWTHTSVALRDAFALLKAPFVEVHITNIMAREPFRHTSLFSDKALATISGCGLKGYEYALETLLKHLDTKE